MSTFNGTVEEFPNIRIDHFRRLPNTYPPQACFLSHVHSDHLQGLESLKMPFVYCSAATKGILLRMEKYPHRINFAKGILEARKQTYRSLKLVLRALPLETPVEIELDPKSKIRVTLFDANHCPGAVMFLIENSQNAILYSGDVRAEPWFVNSLLRNPILLPYSCGVKRLDCIYLDTTFASRNMIYEHFPTKAEGLEELLMKVSKCPSDTLFYFRSWTLGYEDVWIALSNFLQSPIHVDSYQLRIFRSLADNANNVDRGPVLAGFRFGNHHQTGCLTDDSTVLIHSCEPGTECYDRIKKGRNVVWITPVVSRLKDGTEVAEIGAGGGGGDLYQIPELELVDQDALEALAKLCAGSVNHQQAIARLQETLTIAEAKGDSNISLEGVGLDQHEEVTLKQFIQLISKRDVEATRPVEPDQVKTIHFPYARHSSFSELRHLISSFHPRDICPCTVDLDTWTEEVSMQNLFGDLCSESTFRYDQENRLAAEARQSSRSKKRKRDRDTYDSQETATQDSTNVDEIYKSAETSMHKLNDQGAHDQRQDNQYDTRDVGINIPEAVQRLQDALSAKFEDLQYHQEDTNPVTPVTLTNEDRNIPIAHPSRPLPISPPGLSHNDLNPSTTTTIPPPPRPPSHLTPRQLTAYHAATLALYNDDPSEWNDLRLRSMGWKGHTEEETEL